MGEGMLNAVEGIGSAAVIAFLYGLSGWSFAAFNDKVRKWYVTLAVPLLVLTAVMTIVNWGAGQWDRVKRTGRRQRHSGSGSGRDGAIL